MGSETVFKLVADKSAEEGCVFLSFCVVQNKSFIADGQRVEACQSCTDSIVVPVPIWKRLKQIWGVARRFTPDRMIVEDNTEEVA